MRLCLFRGGCEGLKTQSTLCLTQLLHGLCRSHLTFRVAQRIHAKVGLLGTVEGEGVGVAMAIQYSSETVVMEELVLWRWS